MPWMTWEQKTWCPDSMRVATGSQHVTNPFRFLLGMYSKPEKPDNRQQPGLGVMKAEVSKILKQRGEPHKLMSPKELPKNDSVLGKRLTEDSTTDTLLALYHTGDASQTTQAHTSCCL